ncbi:hypothetical protein TTHERM_00279700 (macronuclear) [Tetrahymena thermophila SB210]|uniref:Uncharacterized protein n=1 Tax=Tetrahymena thermophila (strain SB210) TaxID=312017 RepID=I7M8D7_TETTS|nr:hypothetical protein TTHERM_00279700 [Tetrahymena thermophila SB210]EAR97885.1 hypothetical protein TTHERM_00279700 [Tetrahymena thermophila SB210]|eukprot:XP_001018130.1 hypothetical protein TTHERM_00279700 [Tetrahymena thermophila SB210]
MIKVIEKRLKSNSYQTHDILEDSQCNGSQNNYIANSMTFKPPIIFKDNPLYTHRFTINSNERKTSFFQYQQSSDEATCSTLTNNTPINKRISNISQFKYDSDETQRIRNKNGSLFSQQKDSARTPSCQNIPQTDFNKLSLLEEIQNMDNQATDKALCLSPKTINKRQVKSFKLDQSSGVTSSQNRLKIKQREQNFNSYQSDQHLSMNSVEEKREFQSSSSLRMKMSSRLIKTSDNAYNFSSSMNTEIPIIQDSNQCIQLSNKGSIYNQTNSNMSTNTSKQSYMKLIFNEQARTMNVGNFQDYLCYLSSQPNLSVKQKNKKFIKQSQSNARQRRPVNDISDYETHLNNSQKLIQLNRSQKSISSQKDLSLTNISPVPYIFDNRLESSNNLSALISNKKRLSIRLHKVEKDDAELFHSKKDKIPSSDTVQQTFSQLQNQQQSTQKIKTLTNIPSISIIESKKTNMMSLKPISIKKIMEPVKNNQVDESVHKFHQKEDSPTTKTVHFVTSIQNIDINDDSTQETTKLFVPNFKRNHKRNNTYASSPDIHLNNSPVTLKKEKSLISEKTERSPLRIKSMIDTSRGSIQRNSIAGQVKALNFAHRLIQLKDISKATQNIQKCIQKMIEQLKQITQLPKIYHNKSYNFIFDLWSRFPELKNIFLDKEKLIIKTPISVTPKQVLETLKFERLKVVYDLDKKETKITYDQALEKYLQKDFQIYTSFMEEFNMKIQQTQLKNLEKQIIDQQNTISQLEQKMSYNLLCNPNQSQTTSITYAFKEDYNNNLKSFLERGTYLLSKQSEKFETAEKKYGNFENIHLKSKYFGSYISNIYENILKNKKNQNKFANAKRYSEHDDE